MLVVAAAARVALFMLSPSDWIFVWTFPSSFRPVSYKDVRRRGPVADYGSYGPSEIMVESTRAILMGKFLSSGTDFKLHRPNPFFRKLEIGTSFFAKFSREST